MSYYTFRQAIYGQFGADCDGAGDVYELLLK